MSTMKFKNYREMIYDLCINLLRIYPFYGHILSMMSKVETNGVNAVVPTFGVGKRKDEITLKLWYNADYMTECIEEYGHEKAYVHFFEVMKHEVLHVIFGHLSLDLPDKQRAAIAVDLAVNSYLNPNNFVKGKDGEDLCMLPKNFKLPEKQSAIWYYQQLLQNKQYQQMQQEMKDQQSNIDKVIQEIMEGHENWKEVVSDPVQQEIIKDLIKKAKEHCQQNGWGKTPGELISQLDCLLEKKKPLVPWGRVLKLFVASNSESDIDYTMRKRSKRFGIRPGLKKTEKLNLAVGIDTSGSISDEQLCLFMNELKWIEKEGSYIHVFECDTHITRDYPFKNFDGKVEGRGGTDLEPVLERVSKEKFDALIFFTDFYTGKIEKDYRIPTLWVLSENHMNKEDFPYLFPGNTYIRITDDCTSCERV